MATLWMQTSAEFWALCYQAFNLAISAGHPTEFWSMDTLYRWPSGIRIALERSLTDWTTRIGLAGLVLAWFKRDARAWALTGLAVIHVVLIGLAFGSSHHFVGQP